MADKKENVPPKKKRRLSLSLSKRFKNSTEELENLSVPKMPKNTETSTKWVIKNFTDWVHGHNLRNPDNKCPKEVLLPMCSVEILKKWLCMYVAETQDRNIVPCETVWEWGAWRK